MSYVSQFLKETAEIALSLDTAAVDALCRELVQARERSGRVFVLGVGGSAANASHLVNDLRKLCGIEAYAPTDNVAELTARTNDDGWATSFSGWLAVSRLCERDLVLVLSVGGGDVARNISPNLVSALGVASEHGARIGGIVGRDGGYTARVAHACVIIPSPVADHVTPHTEAFQAVVSHLLVSHPELACASATWEARTGQGLP
jgi:D-sedoheptulose 7-phosphate isomerase